MISGWDDAPIRDVKMWLPFKGKAVTFVYPYYENPRFLEYQIERWRAYGPELRRNVSVIIVDDGSPTHKAADVLRSTALPLSTRLFEIEVDVRWNWLAARNIAMHHAPDSWCMATDIDHVIPRETAEHLVWGAHDARCIYRLSRVEHGKPIHPHPNSWFMTKAMFWKFGGYDEALSGYYGTDGEARRRWVKTADVFTLPQVLERWEHFVDSSTTRYKRKQPEDTKAQKLIASRGKDWKPKTLSFPYHEVTL